MKRPDRRFRRYTAQGAEDDFAEYCEARVYQLALLNVSFLNTLRAFADMHILTSAYYWKLYFWVKF